MCRQAVNFTSIGSSGVSYAWNYGDGGTANAPNPSHTFTVAGEYLVMLTTTDTAGRQTTQAQMINATQPNKSPSPLPRPISTPATRRST